MKVMIWALGSIVEEELQPRLRQVTGNGGKARGDRGNGHQVKVVITISLGATRDSIDEGLDQRLQRRAAGHKVVPIEGRLATECMAAHEGRGRGRPTSEAKTSRRTVDLRQYRLTETSSWSAGQLVGRKATAAALSTGRLTTAV